MNLINTAISEFCQTGSGGTPSRNKPEFYGGHIPWIKSGDLKEKTVEGATEFITEAALKQSSAKMVPKGAILLAMYGATVGRMAMLGIEAATNQAVCSIVPDEKQAYPKYVYYALLDKVPLFLRNAVGGAQPNISQGMIRDLKIHLPPLAEQKRIAAILDKADAIRRKRQQAIKLADDFLRATFLDMFGDPYSNQKGWNVLPLSELGRAITGSTPPSQKEGMWGDEIPFITPGDLDSNLSSASRWVTKDGANNSRLCREGSLLVCCIGATIGKVGLAEMDSAFNQQINAQEWNEKIDDVYGYALFKLFPELITANAIQTTLPILKKSLFEEIVIPVPEISLQKKYKSTFEQIKKNKQRWINHLGNELFSALSQKAFSREL